MVLVDGVAPALTQCSGWRKVPYALMPKSQLQTAAGPWLLPALQLSFRAAPTPLKPLPAQQQAQVSLFIRTHHSLTTHLQVSLLD